MAWACTLRVLRTAFAALALSAAGAGSGLAQDAPNATEAAKTVLGAWEMSNAERDRKCVVTLKSAKASAEAQPAAGAATGATLALEFEATCGGLFPFVRTVTGWVVGAGDAIRLVDAKGEPVVEFSEVEGGLYEGERPGEGVLFLQSVAAGRAEERSPEQLAGDWAIMRGTAAKPICQLTLLTTPAANDLLALRLKPGCDAQITRFNPAGWSLDRGQLLIAPARGEPWRFEENEATWRRIPEGRQPLTLVRQ